MREILFRGQRIYNRKWSDGYYVKRQGDHLLFSFDRMGITRKVIPETVGQFIGLLDKNGKKIFEGDILRHSDKFESIIAKVIYERMGYRLIGLKEPIYWNFHSEFEIIGNIHDNPELLCK